MTKYSSYLPNFTVTSLPIISVDDYVFSANESLLDSLSETLSVFYNRITFVDDLTNHFVKIDLIYQNKLKEQFDNFKSVLFSLSSSEKKEATNSFINSTSSSIPPLKEFIEKMRTFTLVVSDITSIVSQCLRTTTVEEVPDIYDLFSNSDIANYAELGISVEDGYIAYENPFSKYPDDTYLREQGYTSLDSVQEVNKTYEFQVLGPLKGLLKIKRYLLDQYGLLKRELENSQNDTENIRIHFKAVLFTANITCNVLSKLLMVNRLIMYRNKALLDIASKSVIQALKDRG